MTRVRKVILFLVSVCALSGFFLSLSQNTRCDLQSLILEDSMMPRGWARLWSVLPPALPKDGAQDALEVVYENRNTRASHTVYRYRNGLLASLLLRVNNEIFFPSGLTAWSRLEGSESWPLHGNEARILCGDSSDPLLGSGCSAVIRYGPLVSAFSAPIEQGIMAPAEFKAIVVAVDARLTSCIRSQTQQP